jgi:ATP-dependent Lon protease
MSKPWMNWLLLAFTLSLFVALALGSANLPEPKFEGPPRPRFEVIYFERMNTPYVDDLYAFEVLHDKETGNEIVCHLSNHLNAGASCFQTGRSWNGYSQQSRDSQNSSVERDGYDNSVRNEKLVSEVAQALEDKDALQREGLSLLSASARIQEKLKHQSNPCSCVFCLKDFNGLLVLAMDSKHKGYKLEQENTLLKKALGEAIKQIKEHNIDYHHRTENSNLREWQILVSKT